MIAASAAERGRRAYRYGPACIELTSDDLDTARWLEEFLTPWFTLGPAGENPLAVRSTCSAAGFAALEREQAAATLRAHACFALDRELVALPGWTHAEETVIADRERGCFLRVRPDSVEIVAQPGVRRARVTLLRVVRELTAARVLAQSGFLDLHAAALGVAEGAILLVGPKRSGKTTLLVDALASGRASLLANDRVFVDARPSPACAFGVPTLVSVRSGTLRWFPRLAQGLPERPALLHAGELAAEAKVEFGAEARHHLALSPAQLARQLGAGVVASAAIAAIVFSEISATAVGWSLESISPVHGAASLRENLYGIAAGSRPLTVLGAAALGAAVRGARRPPATYDASLVDRLASQLPLFRLRLGRDAYADGPGAWLRALPLEPARQGRVA